MKSKIGFKTIAVSILLIAGFARIASAERVQRYDINVNDADIRQVFESVSAKAGLQLDLPTAITGKLTVSFNNKTLDQAIRELSRKARLKTTIVDGVLHVKREDPNEHKVDLNAAPPTQVAGQTPIVGPAPASVTESTSGGVKVIRLNYAKATTLAAKLTELFPKEARIVADEESNSLMIVPQEGSIDRVVKLIASYDQMPKQILIEAQVVETSSSLAREIGMSYGTLRNTASAGTSVNSISVTNPAPGTPNIAMGLLFGSIDNQRLEARLLAAENKGEAKIISRPKVVTGDRINAVIESGISYHVKTLTNVTTTASSSSSSALSGGLQEVNAGLTLNVLPEIVEGNLIKMKIDITSSEADQGSSVDGIPGVVRSAAKTTLVIKEGVTATIGGLVKYSSHDGDSGVPFLSRIPWIGNLFKASTTNHQNSELVIFITPHLMPDPADAKQEASL